MCRKSRTAERCMINVIICTHIQGDEHTRVFISLAENIATTTLGGMLIFHTMGARAEFERDLIRERTNAG